MYPHHQPSDWRHVYLPFNVLRSGPPISLYYAHQSHTTTAICITSLIVQFLPRTSPLLYTQLCDGLHFALFHTPPSFYTWTISRRSRNKLYYALHGNPVGGAFTYMSLQDLRFAAKPTSNCSCRPDTIRRTNVMLCRTAIPHLYHICDGAKDYLTQMRRLREPRSYQLSLDTTISMLTSLSLHSHII